MRLGARAGRDDQPLAGARPPAHPLLPALREPPAGRRACLDRAQQRKLGAVQLPNDRHRREGAQRGLVRRGQMVEMKQLGARRAGTLERVRPDLDQPLVRVVVDRGEHAIGRARPVLVGGLERHAALPRSGE